MKKLLLSLSLIASFTTINAQWTSQATGFTDPSRGLIEIKIVDANTVWAVAYDGSSLGLDIQEFTRTTNGGASWTTGLFDVGNPTLRITNISPVNGTTAWVGVFDETAGQGGVFKTTDSGATWEEQNATAYNNSASWFNVVHFFDDNVGITMGDPIGAGLGEYEMFRTTDGGATWTPLAASALPNPLSGEYGYTGGYVTIGDTMWFTTNKGRIYRTSDRGVTWVAFQSPIGDFGSATESGSLKFSTINNGCLLRTQGTTYTFYTTTNGGQTWSSPSTFSGTRRILNYIPGTNTIVATSADPLSQGTSVSVDNGTTWINVESAEQRGANAFLNSTTGWCAGFSENEITDGVFKLTGQLDVLNVAQTKFKVYPNPATSIVTVSVADVDTYRLSVTDLSGKVVMTKSLNGIENTLDISALATGAYFFELNANNKKEVVKILKN
jgi:photosystem II stability/assembly factor-like uncharacterized protein